jgi:predicted alpha/beta-hydrolase family hydrolase
MSGYAYQRDQMPEFLNSGATNTPCRLLLAHGAGAAMTSPFLDQLTALLVDRGIAVSRFEFAYMAARRSGGKRRPPPAAEKLTGEYHEAIAAVRRSLAAGQRLFIGGKSMGGRVASLIAHDAYAGGDCRGLLCFGYPFHPPGKPEHLRTAHLESLMCPALIVQGERDPFGSRSEVSCYALAPSIAVTWIGDGDHDLGPRGASGFTRKGNLAAAADAAAAFMLSQTA